MVAAMEGEPVAPAGPPPDGIAVGDDGLARCWWGAGDPLYRRYHDTEWGRPVADDRRLFEKLSLEGFQAGLSWLTILRKRERFREVFAGFDPNWFYTFLGAMLLLAVLVNLYVKNYAQTRR